MSESNSASPQVIDMNPERAAGVTNRVGMLIFLASWGMLFGGLFYAYGLLRIRAAAWPPMGAPELPLVLPTVSTLAMLASSVTLHQAFKALNANDGARHKVFVWTTLLLGVAFLVLQGQVVMTVWDSGLRPTHGSYGSLLFFLTIFHGLHVLFGLGILLYLLPTISNRIERFKAVNRTHIASMYWHFVDLIWVIIFVLIFVV